MKTVAIDFESYYDKECSISTLGPMGYFSHPKFDPYMVSVVSADSTWVGDPKKLDWKQFEGRRLVSHNASFDETLYLFGVDQGWWPKVDYAEWVCSADMCAYLGMPRALAQAVKHAYDVEVSKQTRANMAGKRWVDMPKDFQKQVQLYAIDDSRYCLKLWQDYNEQWPEFERRVSLANRRACQRGIPVDADAISENIKILKKQLWDMEQSIPWNGKYKLLSRPAFNEECRKNGLEPPKSLAQDNPEAQEWIDEHGEKYVWIGATINWRRVNAFIKKLEAFEYSTMEDGRYYGNLMYFGAHTGRFSGSGGNLNLQNLPQGEMFGVDLRSLIKAPKGKKFVAIDLSQIEVRTACYAAGDFEMLKEIKDSPDVYETFAIRFGLWSKDRGRLSEVDPKLRSKPVKPMVLGCGFGAGWKKLGMMYGLEDEEAQDAVAIYRKTMKPVVDQWGEYDRGLVIAHSQFRPYKILLPSGRYISYNKIKRMRENYIRKYEQVIDGVTTVIEEEATRMVTLVQRIRNSRKTWANCWGGVVMENVAQGLARDTFVDRWLAVEDAGWDDHVILHVHDELLLEVDECIADQCLTECEEIMSTSPQWIPDLPIAAEGKILDVYTK
jgi:hypothetical protein